jgi:ABC-type multidrug transport system ATPase subunit
MKIETENLTKKFASGIVALDKISCSIETDMLAVLGANGAGKTTLMRILATSCRPTSGRVLVDGVDVMECQGKVRAMLGYLPQQFDFQKKLTGKEVLEYIAVLKGIDCKSERCRQVNTVAELLHLEKTINTRVEEYSLGMKQRLGIAQALIGRPRLLILDEPTEGLDQMERSYFRNLMVELKHKCLIIMTTHVIEDIEACCTQIAVFRQGRIIFQGSPAELIARAEDKVREIEVDYADFERIKSSM